MFKLYCILIYGGCNIVHGDVVIHCTSLEARLVVVLYRSCIELLLEILQLPLPGQVGSPRVSPHFPIRNLGFIVEIEHICEDFVPAFIGFDPRETRAPLNIDFAGLHINHVRKELDGFIS